MSATPKPRRRKGEGSIHFDKPRGIWIGRVTLNGQAKSVNARTQAECVTKLDDLKRELRRGDVVTKRTGLTVADVLDHWLRNTLPNQLREGGRKPAPGTLLKQEAYVRRLTSLIGDRPIARLTVDNLEAAYTSVALGLDARDGNLPRRPAGLAHLERLQATLRQAVAAGVRRRVLSDSVRRVVEDAQLPRQHAAAKGERIALTPDEMQRLLKSTATRRLHAMFLLALSTGLRPGEVGGLLWDDLHLDADPPYVETNHALQRQKNNRFAVVDVLKNAGAYRSIELTADVVAALRAHRKAQAVERMQAVAWANPDLVFASTRGSVLNPSNVRREYSKACIEAGVPVIVPYETRHSLATMLAESDMNTYAIVDMLGHVDDRMLSRTYRKKRKGIVRGATDVINRNLAQS